MNLGLHNKVVVITGGTRGIGQAIAFTCAGEGAHMGSTLSQEAVRARPSMVSPGLGKRQATRCSTSPRG